MKQVTIHPYDFNSQGDVSRIVEVKETSLITSDSKSYVSRYGQVPYYALVVDGQSYSYALQDRRDRDMARLLKSKRGWNMLEGMKEYIKANRDLVGTIVFVAVVDQFLFEGALRERIKKLIEGLLTKVETKAGV